MFKWKIMRSVYSYDGLLLMLVLIVKYVADMGFLQGDGTFCRTCVAGAHCSTYGLLCVD